MTSTANSYGMERAIAEGRYRLNENHTGMIVGTSEMPRRVRIPTGTGHPMKYGDRIFIRLEVPYGRGMNFCTEEVSDMTEVLGVVRERTRGMQGLYKLVVRNATEGWSLERPLKLYPSRFAPRGLGNVRIHEPAPASQTPRMLMPWEAC